MSYPQGDSLSADEKLWGMLAHLLTLLGYVVVVGEYIAPLVIYLVYKDRSRFVAFHALQALFFQLLALAVTIALMLFSVVTLGLWDSACRAAGDCAGDCRAGLHDYRRHPSQ
jgi:uncharacterized Tic20 family protein